MLKAFIRFVIVATLPLVSSADARAASLGELDSLRRLIEESVARGGAPGAVVVVRQNGRQVFEAAAGYAVIEEKRMMRTDDLFMIASSTKPFSATTILTLVDQGKLSLDDPVRKFYPELAGESTVRQLLSHTSGIFGNGASPENLEAIRNFERELRDAVPLIVRAPLAYPPGTKFSYGGASFCVAAGIAEKLTGKAFDLYMRETLLEPLGIEEACFRSPRDLSDRVPQIYVRMDAGGFRPMPAVMEAPGRRGPRPNGFVLAAGGLYATAGEAARFLQLHLDGGIAKEVRVLSPRLVEEMQRRQTGAAAEEYGLGWRRIRFTGDGPAQAFGHGGAYGTQLFIDKERNLAAAIFTQMPSGQSSKLIEAVQARIQQIF